MNKIVVLSIDGFGVGNMKDANIKSNTWHTLLKNSQKHDFPFLKKIMKNHKKIILDYLGADSFLGHLTMSGVSTKQISLHPISYYKKKIIKVINNFNMNYETYKGMIIVNKSFIIYDNFEADYGLAINIAGLKEKITFEEQINFSKEIRKIIKNPRLISFSSNKIKIENLKMFPISENGYFGIKTTKTGIYNNSFEVRHFPAKINFDESIQNWLINESFNVNLYGKFENIINIENKRVNKDQNIDIDHIFNTVINNKKVKQAHFINIQQTDLAGHLSDIGKYISILNNMDSYIKKLFYSNAKLIIISDHGNDPSIKNGKHTREYVPLITNFKTNKKINNLSEIPLLIKGIFDKNQ